MSFLATRVNYLKPSATLAFQEKMRKLQESGSEVLFMNAGEPDFDLPMNVKAQAIEAIHEGRNKYTAVRGIPELLEAIVSDYQDNKKLTYSFSEVMVTNGAKQGLFNAFLSLINEGDEVVIPAPFWGSYRDMVHAVGGKAVIVNSKIENNFCMSPEDFEAAITPKTKCVIFNSPSNPSGQVISRELYLAYADILRRNRHVFVICDDVYELINWACDMVHFLTVAPDLIDRTLIINSLSKSFAMTGWRIGYALGPDWLIKVMLDYQSQSTSNICSVAQYAGTEALTGGYHFLDEMLKAYKLRHDMMYNALSKIDGVEVIRSKGAFYLYPKVSGLLDRLNMETSEELSLYCLENAHIGIMPGNSFGMNDHMRFSFSGRYDKLEEGLRRFAELVKS